VRKSDFVRIAVDNSIINWKAGQGLEASIQSDPAKRQDYWAIEKLFKLQEKGRVILVAVDQLDRELRKTSHEERRNKLIETERLCKENYYLTRFEALTQSRRRSKSAQKSGINLKEGARWVTDDDMRKIREYIAIGRNLKDKVDLEVLATVAIAGVHLYMTVDYKLLARKHIREFVKRKDGIWMYRPSEILMLVDASPAESEG
jgi:hypothetical protein